MLPTTMIVLFFQLLRFVDCLEPRSCPRCIDDEFSHFVDHSGFKQCNNYNSFNHNFLFSKKFECEKHDYSQIDCQGSCVRVRLTRIENNRTETLGWTFGCADFVIKSLPETAPKDASNFKNKLGDWQFVDRIYNQGSPQYAFETQFFSQENEVELVAEYNLRVEKEEQAKKEEFFHGFAASAILLLVLIAIVFILLKTAISFLCCCCRCCGRCCSEKNDEDFEPYVIYHRREIENDYTVIIENPPLQQQQQPV